MFNRKDKKKFQSAKFKRDYVTFIAITIFVVMVVSELVVAITIPLLVRYSNIYAEEGVRHNLIKTFDETRVLCIMSMSNPEVPVSAKADMNFILKNLDIIALDLRSKQVNMPISEAEELLGYIKQYNAILNEFNGGREGFLSKVPLNIDDNIYDLVDELDSLKNKEKEI